MPKFSRSAPSGSPEPGVRALPVEAARRGRGLTAHEAAEFLGVKISTLAKWRQLGIGPPYSDRLGRDPRYHSADLDDFLWGEGVVRNSVEAKHRRRRRRATAPSNNQETA